MDWPNTSAIEVFIIIIIIIIIYSSNLQHRDSVARVFIMGSFT